MNTALLTQNIKDKALQLGFDACGIACAAFLEDEDEHLNTWLRKNMHADMDYMQKNIDKRLDPRLLLNNAKSLICLLVSYKPVEKQEPTAPKIARYAYGNDYHDIIWSKLKQLLNFIQQQAPETNGRGFTDSAPVLERAWAVKAGLGWIGKNSTLISPKYGSFTFLAELIVDIELEYDTPYPTNGCGACNRCIANCPTKAICEPKIIDANKCISYQTIENKAEISTNTNGWLFGCDICLQVCPWNKRTDASNHPEFAPIPCVLSMGFDDWDSMTEDDFKRIFKNSPIIRSKFAGIKRNLNHIKLNNNGV